MTKYFEGIEDRRQQGKIKYQLVEVIVITIIAVTAGDVLFNYIQDRVSKLHEQKSALERKLQTKTRKRKAIDTKPLEEPMSHWDEWTVQEKHNVAVMMIEVVYVSDENGVEVIFSI